MSLKYQSQQTETLLNEEPHLQMGGIPIWEKEAPEQYYGKSNL